MHSMKSCKFLTPVLFALLTCAAPPAPAQTYTVLHTFESGSKDGEAPLGTLARDASGNLYGTTQLGGSGRCGTPDNPLSCGTVFMLDKHGKELGVFSFDGRDGIGPQAGLLRDSAGNLYGTTYGLACGNRGRSCGTAFQLNRTGTKLRYFGFSGGADGGEPASPVIELSGNFYGTTEIGGTNGFGTIYAINPQGKETVLYNFEAQSDGCDPLAGLTADSSGNLYGVSYAGCDSGAGYGSVYELDAAGNFTVLFPMSGAVGIMAASTLTLDPQGNLYGPAFLGGSSQGCGIDGCGTVFEVSPNNGTWSGRALYSFCSLPGCADGAYPWGGLVRDASGNIYGTTIDGGTYTNCTTNPGCGTIFKLDPSGNETVLHNFTGGSDGANPLGGLIIDASGNLYGTAYKGGDTSCDPQNGGCGVVFELTP
jgi:uncharacterized repeat protein (TIGR03803 family)